MNKFFIDDLYVNENKISITGEDVNHIKNVLRMRVGEEILICDGKGTDYTCEIESIDNSEVVTKVVDYQKNAAELPTKITLYQGVPKADKLELIIQKAVELGACRIVPVFMSRSVVKLDDKRQGKKLERYNAIAKSAAEQSKRGVIPEVSAFMNYKQAMEEAFSNGDKIIVPYEDARGITHARELVDELAKNPPETLSIFIGPEGGFAEEEIALAKEKNAEIMTLGGRILRTETAGLTTLSILSFVLDRG